MVAYIRLFPSISNVIQRFNQSSSALNEQSILVYRSQSAVKVKGLRMMKKNKAAGFTGIVSDIIYG